MFQPLVVVRSECPHRAPPRSRRTRAGSSVALILALLTLPACKRNPAPEPVADTEATPARLQLSDEAYRSAAIEVAVAGRHPLESERRLTGSLGLDESRVSRVSAAVPGRITRVHVSPGDPVRVGDVLVEMESSDMASALAAYSTASAEAELRQAEKERGTTLLEGKAISRADLLRREAESRQALAALAEARQRLCLLGLKPDELDQLTTSSPAGSPAVVGSIRASIAGRVVARKATSGQNVAPGEELLVIADLSRLWLLLQVYEQDLPFVTKGQQVEVRMAAYPGKPFQGSIDYVADAVDSHTRTVSARVLVDNRAGLLKAGMYAEAVIRLSEETSAITVPASAVTRVNGLDEVFVVTGEREFERRGVTVGRSTEEWTEILSGLSAGERIAVKGTFVLKSEVLKGTLAEED